MKKTVSVLLVQSKSYAEIHKVRWTFRKEKNDANLKLHEAAQREPKSLHQQSLTG